MSGAIWAASGDGLDALSDSSSGSGSGSARRSAAADDASAVDGFQIEQFDEVPPDAAALNRRAERARPAPPRAAADAAARRRAEVRVCACRCVCV